MWSMTLCDGEGVTTLGVYVYAVAELYLLYTVPSLSASDF